jgi:hypothetical protein
MNSTPKESNFFLIRATSAAHQISEHCYSLALHHVPALWLGGSGTADEFYWLVDVPWKDETDTLRLISTLIGLYGASDVSAPGALYVCDGLGYVIESDPRILGNILMRRQGTWAIAEDPHGAFEVLGVTFKCVA